MEHLEEQIIEKRLIWNFIAIFIIMNILDIATTYWYLSIGGAEANPLFRALLHNGYWITGVILKTAGAVFSMGVPLYLFYKTRYKEIGKALLYINVGGITATVMGNLMTLYWAYH